MKCIAWLCKTSWPLALGMTVLAAGALRKMRRRRASHRRHMVRRVRHMTRRRGVRISSPNTTVPEPNSAWR